MILRKRMRVRERKMPEKNSNSPLTRTVLYFEYYHLLVCLVFAFNMVVARGWMMYEQYDTQHKEVASLQQLVVQYNTYSTSLSLFPYNICIRIIS